MSERFIEWSFYVLLMQEICLNDATNYQLLGASFRINQRLLWLCAVNLPTLINWLLKVESRLVFLAFERANCELRQSL